MRSDDDIGTADDCCRGSRFAFHYIQRSTAQQARIKRPNQSCIVDERPAADIDQQGAACAASQEIIVHPMLRRRRQRQMQYQGVRLLLYRGDIRREHAGLYFPSGSAL